MFIYLFCAGDTPVDPSAIEAFIEEGVYYDNDPGFHVHFENGTWIKVEITPDIEEQPVIIHHLADTRRIQQYVQKAISEIEAAGVMKKHQDLTSFLEHIKQAFLFQIDNELLTDDSWEMLDNLEAWIAQMCKGVVYVPREGFYDADLNPICKF